MENIDNNINQANKVTEALTKELESLSDEGLHEFFKFVHKMNHYQGNMIAIDRFEEFLEAFDNNPFKVNEDKAFRKQLIENIIKYAHYHMSLITAAVLIKKKFTIEEISQNYYSSLEVFENMWF